MNVSRRTYTVEEAAEILGIKRTLAYRLVRTGEIPAIKLGRRWVIPQNVLSNMLEVAPTTHSNAE